MGLIAFKALGLPVYAYGLVLLLALLLGLGLAWLNVRLHGERFAPVTDMLLWGLPLSLLLGRLGYVLHHFDSYTDNLLTVFCIWQGGLSSYGEALGAFLALYGVCRVQGLSTWRWLDLLVPSMLLMLAVRAAGVFALQLEMGAPFPADIPNDHTLAEYIEYSYRPFGFQEEEYFQPIALYQAGLQLGATLILLVLTGLRAWLGRPRRAGCLFLAGVALAAAIRCGCGYYYLASAPQVLPLGRVLSGGLALLAGAWLLVRCRPRPQGEERTV